MLAAMRTQPQLKLAKVAFKDLLLQGTGKSGPSFMMVKISHHHPLLCPWLKWYSFLHIRAHRPPFDRGMLPFQRHSVFSFTSWVFSLHFHAVMCLQILKTIAFPPFMPGGQQLRHSVCNPTYYWSVQQCFTVLAIQWQPLAFYSSNIAGKTRHNHSLISLYSR